MQLDVLSVFKLPAASGSQTGLYTLQENGWLTLKEFREQRRRGFSWTSTCGLFACSRSAARYAVDPDVHGAEFALVKASAKPSAWVLFSDDKGRLGSVRVEPLRGHHPQPPALPLPHGLPSGDLLGTVGLSTTLGQAGEPHAHDMELQPSVASCQVMVDRPLGTVSPRTQLIAHAYWRSTCPGKVALAVARRDAMEWKSPSPGPAKHINGANGGVDDWHPLPEQAPIWQWSVVRILGDFDYVGVSAHIPDHMSSGAPSSPGVVLPVLRTVRVLWHPQGCALALCFTGDGGRDCVAVLDGGSLEVLWHRRLEAEAETDGFVAAGAAPGSPLRPRVSSMAWVPHTSLLAVIDAEGHLQLLDSHGGRKEAALLCGAIKYGETAVVRLGPILGKAVPLPAGSSTALGDFTVLSCGGRRESAGGVFGNGGGAVPGGGDNGDTGMHAFPGHQQQHQQCFSLAFDASRSLSKSPGLDTSPGAIPAAAAGGNSLLMAVCNGTSMALVRLNFFDEAATPMAEYGRRFQVGAGGAEVVGVSGGGGGRNDSPFAQSKSGDKPDDSPDRDLVPALRPVGMQGQLDGLDTMASFGHSGVSTPYMLGLQRVSVGGSSITTTGGGGAAGSGMGGAAAGMLLTCRSNASEPLAPPPWPLRWRTVLTLPPPCTVHGAASVTAGPWGTVGVSKSGGPPSSIATSSVTLASKLDRGGLPAGGWGAFPSPAASATNFLDPSVDGGGVKDETASSAAGDAAPPGVSATDGHGGSSLSPNSGASAWPEVLLCTAPGPQLALRQGDVMVLRGSMAEALQFYPRAHVYGFLPAFLVLVHLHRIDAAARLLRAYAHFTGQVAAACAGGGEAMAAAAATSAAAATAPDGGTPNVVVLSQQWQVTMSGILDSAFTEHATTSVGGFPGPGVRLAGRLRSNDETAMRWQSSLQRVQEHPPTLDSDDPDGAGEGNAVAAAPVPDDERLQAAHDPASAEAEVGRGGGRWVPPSPLQTPDGVSGDYGALISVPGSATLGEQPARPTALVSDAAPPTAAGPDASEDLLSSLPADGETNFGSPLQSPSAALQEMLRACLQLLLLACHAMAFVAFSAHSAGRAVAAAAAADLLALPMSPASPRSPGGGVLSRQAMRRLSSTVRMRSLKTRSVSMFGPPALGAGLGSASPSGHYLVTANSVTGGGGAAPSMRMDNAVPCHGGTCSATSSVATAVAGMAVARQTPASASMVIGFPIPVVWQLLPCSQMPPTHQPSLARGGGSGTLTVAQLTISRQAAQQPASGASTRLSHAGASGGPVTEVSTSVAVSTCHSPPGSPLPLACRQHHQHQPATSTMRLQLHHCAFDLTRLWQDASAQQLPLGQSAASVYLKPSYAAGLLLMAHACSVQLQELHQHRQQHQHRRHERLRHACSAGDQHPPHQWPQQHQQHHHHGQAQGQAKRSRPQQHPHAQTGVLRLGGNGDHNRITAVGRAARVNWHLLRATSAATHAAAVWQQLNDWHRAALLVFACANALTQQGGGTEDLPMPTPQKRRASEPGLTTRSAGAPPHAQEDRQSGASGAADPLGGGGGSNGGRCGILAAARVSCLRMGQQVLLSQVSACQKMEVQDACGVMLELVALPRRLLGPQSAVHISLLQKVCTRVVDLLPARVSITPLLPAGAVPPLVQLSHAGIRSQLVAHCGAAVARVLEELRLAAACGGGLVSLRDAVQQIADHSTVDSCVRMMLRWQGSYDGVRVDAAAARLAESVQDATLLPDTSDWSPDSVLPSLQDAFVTSGLLSIADAAAVSKAARAAAAAASHSGPQLEEIPPATAASGGGPAGAPADPSRGLQDLDELALLLDLTQLQHTLLASLQPFLHDALLVLRGAAPARDAPGDRPDAVASVSAGGSVWLGEDEHEEELADSSMLAALPPLELAVSCLKLLLKLQWAMHCRAQVCALMLRLVRLQAQPPPLAQAISVATPATQPLSTTANPFAIDPCGPVACGVVGASCGPEANTAPREGSQPLVHRAPSMSSGQVHTSPRSLSHASIGHRSFREYIHHMASGNPALGPSQSAGPAEQQQQQALEGALSGNTGEKPGGSGGTDQGGLVLPTDGRGVVAASVPLPELPDPAAELQQVQDSLMAWTAALVRADVFHSSNELQGCVLTVLAVVKSCPHVLVTALNRALERREILNKALAEQVRRLQRSAPPPATAAVTPTLPPQPSLRQHQQHPQPITPTLAATKAVCLPVATTSVAARPRVSAFAAAGGVPSTSESLARAESWSVPGGAMAPSPSFAAAPTPSFAIESGPSSTTGDDSSTGLSVMGSPPRVGPASSMRAGSFALPGLPVARVGSFAPRALTPAEGGLSVVAEGADDGDADGSPGMATGASASPPLMSVPPCTKAPAAGATSDAPMPPTVPPAAAAACTLPAVAAGGLTVRCPPATLAPSQPGTASAATASASAVSSSSQVHPVHLAVAAAHSDIWTASLQLLEYYADPSGALPSGLSTGAGGSGAEAPNSDRIGAIAAGAGRTPVTAEAGTAGGDSDRGGQPRAKHRQRPRLAVSRSQAVSRTRPHSTLLQCLVCELVRTAHSVTASVSWKATLEGGRGLAGCFVHPILHGGSSAAVASAAAAAAEGAAASSGSGDGGSRGGKATASKGGRPSCPRLHSASSDEIEGLGSVPGFVPCAEGAQALLLSLLDVQRWGAELKPLPVPSARGSNTGYGGLRAVAAATAAAGEDGCATAPPTDAGPGGASDEEDLEEEDESAEDGEAAPRRADEDDDGGTAEEDRVLRPSSQGSPQGNTSRLSFSGLTDGDADSTSYPNPGVGGGGGSGGVTSIDAKAPPDADRNGNSSIRQHTNPAYGLHSPTPSNLSEFWDDNSDLASPQSTSVTPPATGSRPSTAPGRTDAAGRLLWRDGSITALADGGGGGAASYSSPQDTRAASSELPGATGSAAAEASPASARLCTPTADAMSGDGWGVAATEGPAVSEAEPGPDGVADGEQLPTLSYLINVQTLTDIRRAVQDAHSAGAGGDAAAGSTADSPTAVAEARAHSRNVRAGGNGVGDATQPLSEERSGCSFGPAPGANGINAASEVSVRGGLSAFAVGGNRWVGQPGEANAATTAAYPAGPESLRVETAAATATALTSTLSTKDDSGTYVGHRASDPQTPLRQRTPPSIAGEASGSAEGGSELTFDSPSTRAAAADAPALLFGGRGVAAAGSAGGSAGRSAIPRGPALPQGDGAAGLGLGFGLSLALEAATPQVHTVVHSPLPRKPTNASAPSAPSGFGGRRGAPPPPPLPLADFYHSGLGTGQSLVQPPGPSSPSACSIASSISLASPRLATAGSSNAATGWGLALGLGQTSSSLNQAQPTPSQDSLQLEKRQHQQPNLRSSWNAPGAGVLAARTPHPQSQQRSPPSSSGRGGGGGAGLVRSASTSASVSARSRLPAPPSSAATLITSPSPPACHLDCRPNGDSTSPASPLASTSAGSGIQLQDFLREPSTGSTASPWALPSEFLLTPQSQPLESTITTVRSTGSRARLNLAPNSGELGPAGDDVAAPLQTSTDATVSSPVVAPSTEAAYAADRPPSPPAAQQQQHRLHFSACGPAVRAAVPDLRRTSGEAGSVSAAANHLDKSGSPPGVGTPGSAGKHHQPPPLPHQHQRSMQRRSRDNQSAWGRAGVSGRRLSYELAHPGKITPRSAGSATTAYAAAADSDGGEGINPLYTAQAAALFGGSPGAEQQQPGPSGRGGSAGSGGGTGRGPPKLLSAKAGSFSGRATAGAGRAVWH